MYFFKTTTPDVWTSGRKLRPRDWLAFHWPYTPLHRNPERDTGARHYLALVAGLAVCGMLAYQLPLTGTGAVIIALVVALVAVGVLITPLIVHGIAMDRLELLQQAHWVRLAVMQDTPCFAIARTYRRWIEAGGHEYVLGTDHEDQLNAWLEKRWRDDEAYVQQLSNADSLESSEVADIKLRAMMDAVVSFHDLSHLPGYEAFRVTFEGSIEALRRDLEQALAADIMRRECEEGVRLAQLRAMRRRLDALRTATSVV